MQNALKCGLNDQKLARFGALGGLIFMSERVVARVRRKMTRPGIPERRARAFRAYLDIIGYGGMVPVPGRRAVGWV